MEILRLMVKSIIVIIMLAAFLEIVLPRSDMKRYVNLVIGLFVILAMLNPILSVVNKGIELDVFDGEPDTAADTESLIRKGKEISMEEQSRATEQYRKKLSKQIMGIAALYQQTKTTGVKIEMVDDPSARNFGQIKKIILNTESSQKSAKDDAGQNSPEGIEVNVNDINIETGKSDNKVSNNNDTNRGLKEVIADFYGLSPDQIQIDK